MTLHEAAIKAATVPANTWGSVVKDDVFINKDAYNMFIEGADWAPLSLGWEQATWLDKPEYD